MTLQQLFDQIGDEPTPIFIFFAALPLLSLLFAWIAKGEANRSPWNYIFTVLVFLVSVPGIFAFALCVYSFLFLRQSFLDVNILVYFLPIISMIVTFLIIKRVIELDDIPYIGKLSGMLMMMMATIGLMFVLDRTHIIAFVRIPVQYLLIFFVVLFIAFGFGFRKLFKG